MSSSSVTKVKLLVSAAEARKKLLEQISAGERLQETSVEREWDSQHAFSAEKRIWSDYVCDLLLKLFDATSFSVEFLAETNDRIDSGSVVDFIREAKYGIVRGLAYLRSLEKRLDLRSDAKTMAKIPVAVIGTVADVLQSKYTHNRLDSLMKRVGIPGDPPEGNKSEKGRAWLHRANATLEQPLSALGLVLEEFMESDTPEFGAPEEMYVQKAKIKESLRKSGLAYGGGGRMITSTAGATRVLEDLVRSRDLAGVQTEFDRISRDLESDPASAVTASSAMLESLFQIFIEDEGLTMPSDKSIKPLWNVVRKHLRLEPADLQDEDLRKVLSGLASIVDGIASLRTHKGSAHGQGRSKYRLKPRHARLVVHSASTLATFILETWDERKTVQ
jgi:hypothetical protein